MATLGLIILLLIHSLPAVVIAFIFLGLALNAAGRK
jgi:hypothetical protein